MAEYGSAPAFGEGHQYALPANYLALISLNELYAAVMPEHFRIEMVDNTKVLITDEDAAMIRYVYRNDIPATYSASFVRAMSTTLAAELAYQITGDARKSEMLLVKAEREVAKAMHENANEVNQTLKSPTTDSWLVRARRISSIG